MAGTNTTFDPRSSDELFARQRLALTDAIEIGGRRFPVASVIERLETHLTAARVETLRRVVAQRSFHVVSVLENIYDRGNVSAVMRSADAFGFLRMHLIDAPGAKFKAANRVSKGTEKWLDVHLHRDPETAVARLRQDGYRIYATHLDTSRSIEDLDFSVPTAIVLGNERDGVSPQMLDQVDGVFCIPMRGFAQSFNISVAAALILYHARLKCRDSLQPGSPIFEQVLANYYLRCFDNPDLYFR